MNGLLASVVVLGCGSERPPPAGETAEPPRYVAPGSSRADASAPLTRADLDAYCRVGGASFVVLPLHFEGKAAVGAACCPDYGPRDCPHYACVCADGATDGCTVGCAQECAGPMDDPYRCRPLTCTDPTTLCTGLPGVDLPICKAHGGVVGVRVAVSDAECGVDAGVGAKTE